jgi:hypothetical protein
LTLRIVLEKPPKGVDFGLQEGRGNDYQVVQVQRSAGKDLMFEFSAEAKAGNNGAHPILLGPFVQGPPSNRFVYLDIGACAGQMDTPWSRRLKVPLAGITKAMAESGAVLEVRVPGTGKDGGPNCATVKPFSGWTPCRK